MAGSKWSAMDPLAALSSGENESSSDDEGDDESEPASASRKVEAVAGDEAAKKKTAAGLDYEVLSRHGYTGGLSIMNVPAPNQDAGEQDWSWSSGKRKGAGDPAERESIDLRERTREAIGDEAELAAARAVAAYNFTKKQKRDAIAEQKAVSFAQKEKRKREMGQASRGKNYVEEEKRLLRDSGVYSGFDT
ncbi:hypothetical protein M758_7G179600 [Ceratodon purpureus]|uniref:Uncharacterized protein n=1 Tax=Ceratodon purpureus TaxID=3225 RepID=A0A8T0HCK9_CERPU|nr:hypothetical protein KC19_7G182000 [Ceratodon purpureus]KAG0611958.1 hypothetical protein M758_7G179600 [Ceratodon purpureus]